MYYLVCFICSLAILVWIISNERKLGTNAILVAFVTVIGDGGYYALASSTSLNEALLSNELTYTIGLFAPMLFFFNICDICKIHLHTKTKITLYLIQIVLFLSACTAGKLDIFYKTVEFHYGPSGGYLIKTYGFAHTLYLISMAFYFIISIAISFKYSRKKNIVSARDVDILIFLYFLMFSAYAVERLIHMKVELMPFIYTIGIFGILIPVVKIANYAIETNPEILEGELKEAGLIVLSNKLLYMDCNDNAVKLFPELSQWEKEERIPGNGGRFNTFLRQDLMRYVESGADDSMAGKEFTVQGEDYYLELSRLHKGKKAIGYLIKFTKKNG